VRVTRRSLFASPEKRNLVLGLLLVVATLAIYNPVARHPFVNYDDDRYVTDNLHVRAGLRGATVRWAVTTLDEANWHPLTWLSHALDCQLFGLNPAGHHYVNVLLHAMNALLLFWVLWRATGATGRSWMVATLFALHPVNVESVAWVAERKNILSMLFLLLALAAYGIYARRPSVGRFLEVVILFACGLMAKPMIITLPFVLLLWDYWPLRRVASADAGTDFAVRPFSWLVMEKLPLMILSAISAIVTMKAQRAGEAIRSVVQYPMEIRLENAEISYARYAGKAFWPSHLSPIYPHPGHSLNLWQAGTAGFLLLVVTVLVIAARRHRYLLVGWFWFLGTLVPMIGLVQVGNQAMADRYAYLPFVGLFIFICWGATEWAAAQHVSMKWLAAAGAICLFGLAMVAHRQLSFWKDNVTLWSHAVEVTPPNFIAEDNLGGALIEAGHTDEAMVHFRRAAAIEPSDPMSRLNLAADEQRHGNIPLAVAQLTRVIEATNDGRLRATAFTDLGYCYRQIGDRVDAKQSFQAAINLRPGTFRAWLGLGLLAQTSGDSAEAIRDYSNGVAVQPWDLGYYLLARTLQQQGRTEESQAALQQAKRLSTDFSQLQQVADELLAK
jgi:protein O-mannosyl-transferase